MCCQVPPPLSVLFKGLTFLFNHVLQLSLIGSHIGIVLILPKEGSNQILPSADAESFQISVPNDHGSSQAILEKVHQQLFIPRMRPHLTTIHLEMVLRTSHPFIPVEIRYLEFWGDDDVRY